MKTLKLLTIIVIGTIGSTILYSFNQKETKTTAPKLRANQINLFVTHGHCSSPFAGQVSNFLIDIPKGVIDHNPIEDLKVSFDLDASTFTACYTEEITKSVQTPGLFTSSNNEPISFKSTDIYTMGLDWYVLKGVMNIKGVEHEMKFMVSGIRDSKNLYSDYLIFEGKINLEDWGINYDRMVTGKDHENPTKWMHINFKVSI